MVHKIFDRLNSMNNFSKNIIKWGCVFSFILCMMGVAVITYNQNLSNEIAIYKIGSTMIYTSIVSFAQFVVGSLIIDFFGVLLSNRE